MDTVTKKESCQRARFLSEDFVPHAPAKPKQASLEWVSDVKRSPTWGQHVSPGVAIDDRRDPGEQEIGSGVRRPGKRGRAVIFAGRGACGDTSSEPLLGPTFRRSRLRDASESNCRHM